MHISSLFRVERNARRLTEILAILGKYGLADWLGGLNYEWLQGRLVRFDGESPRKLTHEARIRLPLTELATPFTQPPPPARGQPATAPGVAPPPLHHPAGPARPRPRPHRCGIRQPRRGAVRAFGGPAAGLRVHRPGPPPPPAARPGCRGQGAARRRG